MLSLYKKQISVIAFHRRIISEITVWITGLKYGNAVSEVQVHFMWKQMWNSREVYLWDVVFVETTVEFLLNSDFRGSSFGAT